ncbi:MAG: extracellular solute-binding protein [Anaerolineaceae bacterium]|jgi:ABC-type glycerol-3-phosphate transport system substrate-binding protein
MRRKLPRRRSAAIPGILLAWLAAAWLLAGCDLQPLSTLFERPQPVVPAAELPVVATPTPQHTPTPEPPQPADPMALTLWVPPEMDPRGGSQSAILFQSRIDSFVARNPGIEVRVRVKAQSGPGSLMEGLSAATVAATRVVPSLVALPRSDLETAALKGLVYPLDDLTNLMEDLDWYPYARQLAVIANSTFGLPFGGESLLLVYRPERIGIEPNDWYALLGLGRPIAFPADDPSGVVTLALYQSAGGIVQDAQRRPVLQTNSLTEVLTLYSDGARQGAFPPWVGQLQSDDQAWEAFTAQRANMLLTWSTRYLTHLPVDSKAVPLPSLGEQPFSLATGWLWAVSDPDPARRAVAVRLAEYLVESEYLADWTAAAGKLPPRPAALENWLNQSLRALVEPLALSMQVRPTNDIMAALGPVLHDAAQDVIRHQVEPAVAAEAAAYQLNR